MEKWKSISGDSLEFEYEVSDMGNVRSLNYNRTGKAKVLKKRGTPSGHDCVLMAGKKTVSIATLVLRYFGFDQPSPQHVVKHKDGNARNNALENLAWQTKSEQNRANRLKGIFNQRQNQ
jgi:hypothetical protein